MALLNIKTKKEFEEISQAMYKEGARFEFDNCEVILLGDKMFVRDGDRDNKYIVDTRTGIAFYRQDGEILKDNVVLPSSHEIYARALIIEQCNYLPKQEAERILNALKG